MSRIKVKYTRTHANHQDLIGKLLELDTATGTVYDQDSYTNGGFRSTGPGVWGNGLSELTEIVEADTPVTDLKFDAGKPRWGLVMGGLSQALAGVVDVLTFGAKKYQAHSWRQVANGEERYRDALYRHLHAIERGERLDPESGLPHWSHVATNALFLHELEIQNEQ